MCFTTRGHSRGVSRDFVKDRCDLSPGKYFMISLIPDDIKIINPENDNLMITNDGICGVFIGHTESLYFSDIFRRIKRYKYDTHDPNSRPWHDYEYANSPENNIKWLAVSKIHYFEFIKKLFYTDPLLFSEEYHKIKKIVEKNNTIIEMENIRKQQIEEDINKRASEIINLIKSQAMCLVSEECEYIKNLHTSNPDILTVLHERYLIQESYCFRFTRLDELIKSNKINYDILSEFPMEELLNKYPDNIHILNYKNTIDIQLIMEQIRSYYSDLYNVYKKDNGLSKKKHIKNTPKFEIFKSLYDNYKAIKYVSENNKNLFSNKFHTEIEEKCDTIIIGYMTTSERIDLDYKYL
jgi:hypothetical protein